MRNVGRASIWLLAAQLAVAGAPAASQKTPEAVGAVYSLGRCIVAADRMAAARLLETIPLAGGEIETAQEQIASSTGCLKRGLPSPSGMLLRGAITQQLFLQDFKEFGVHPGNKGKWIDLKLPDQADGTGPREGTHQLYRWADCVVRNDTFNTERLLKSRAGSRRESAILANMQPFMAACLGENDELKVASSEIRSLFAQSAYNSLYRYWTGKLRQAGIGNRGPYAFAGDNPREGNFVVCDRLDQIATHVRTHKICMTRKNWETVAQRTRLEWSRALDTGLK